MMTLTLMPSSARVRCVLLFFPAIFDLYFWSLGHPLVYWVYSLMHISVIVTSVVKHHFLSLLPLSPSLSPLSLPSTPILYISLSHSSSTPSSSFFYPPSLCSAVHHRAWVRAVRRRHDVLGQRRRGVCHVYGRVRHLQQRHHLRFLPRRYLPQRRVTLQK